MGIRRFISKRWRGSVEQAAALREIRDELTRLRHLEARKSDAILATLRSANRLLVDSRRISEGIQYALTQDDLRAVEEFASDHVLDFEATLRRIADERMSFARFGDGEFRAMLNLDHDLRFQIGSPGLQADLRAVLTYERYDPARLLLGFPLVYRSPHWQKVWSDVWPRLSMVLPRNVEYGVTHATRPICFRRLRGSSVELWRRVWDGLDVCVITGKDSRFTMHPALFDNIASAEYLYSTPKDAYVDLDRLVRTAAEMADRDQFLISLGPAGTVLAAELSRLGKWAVDIGHLSASYQHVFEGAATPEHREPSPARRVEPGRRMLS